MRTLLAITKALSDGNRVRIVCALHERGELCVCQVQGMLGLAPSSTSKHLSLLAGAGLVVPRKQGRWAWYRLANPEDVPHDGWAVLQWVAEQAAADPQVESDRRALDAILAVTPEELCQRLASGESCCPPAPLPGEAK